MMRMMLMNDANDANDGMMLMNDEMMRMME